jgi:serine/threonine protein kinase/Tfp pilus assembly protein PilF
MSEMDDPTPSSQSTLERCVTDFEAARARDAAAPPLDAVPPPGHRHYARVVCELVRIDLEMGWGRGRPRDLDAYRRDFPDVFRDPAALGEIAFEEYRQRREHGENPSPQEYHDRYGIDVGGWPPPGVSGSAGLGSDALERTLHAEPDFAVEKAARAYDAISRRAEDGDADNLDDVAAAYHVPPSAAELFLEAHRANPEEARRLAQAVTSLPAAGDDFLDFRLVDVLGRGAFGRVFLAEQKGLANRRVALKISTHLFDESQTLAQLQHTNVVPIYSMHQSGTLQALCMPYFGSLTLADLMRDLAGRPSLPVSGDHLVSTLQNRRTTYHSVSSSSVARTAWGQSPRSAQEEGRLGSLPPQQPVGRPVTDALCKLKNFGYVEAVLWLGGRLAGALAHAHERGICHRDLKPANVLLTDEGQPMLLDFNLSENQNLRRGAAAARVGGTLPYTAPEHLAAFRDTAIHPDARSDIYSLGLILYELLTGHHAFPTPTGTIREVLPQLIEGRRRPVPEMRPWNARVSPAAEAIVRRCLEHDAERRYQSAVHLREDIERHLAHLPLKHAQEPSLRERAAKFRRRHPLLTSSASLITLSAVLVVGLTGALVAAQQRYARLDAADVLSHAKAEMHQAKLHLSMMEPDRRQLEEGLARCRKVLETYPVVDVDDLGRGEVRANPRWERLPAVRNLQSDNDRRQLNDDLGEVLLLYVRAVTLEAEQEKDPARRRARAEFGLHLADQAEQHLGESRAARLQRARLLKTLGNEAAARDLAKNAETVPLRTGRDHYLAGMEHLGRREFPKARPLFQEATRLDPQNFWTWFYLGLCHAEELRHDEAAYCFTACLALAPRPADAYHPYFNRGLVYLRSAKFRAAHDDLSAAVRLQPDAHGALVQRAVATRRLGDVALKQGHGDAGRRLLAEAERDLTRALALKPKGTWVYFVRAAVRDKLGDMAGAGHDRREGVRLEPDDVAGWIDRGYARLAGNDKESTNAALADFEKALALNPRSVQALQNKAHVLGERLGQTEEAVKVLDKALELYPGYVPARLGRGVLLARLGQRERAVADAREALRLDDQPPTFYQASNVYALTSREHPEDRFQAYPLLSVALRRGFGLDIIDQDGDMDPIRDTPEFRELVGAARKLQGK